MKRIFLVLFLLVGYVTASFAQCDKKIILQASKSQELDANGDIQRTKNENTTVEISETEITINIINTNGNFKLTGDIRSKICNWKVPFKDGKMVINTTLKGNYPDSSDYTITIEGKDGKVTLLAEGSNMPNEKLKLNIEKFEEEN